MCLLSRQGPEGLPNGQTRMPTLAAILCRYTSDRHLELTNAVDRDQRTDFIIDVKVCAMVRVGIGRPNGMLTRLCLRTIPLHRQSMRNSASMRAVMLLSLMPFSFCSGLFWWYWLSGGEISVRFGFSGTSTA